MFKITITIVIIFVYLRHRLSFGANSDINYSRIRALMDGKTPRCVLNQPIRTYKAQSKFHCLIGCSRNPNCTGVVVWISGALLCKEIGQPPYIFVVAPLLCTFYQSTEIIEEKIRENQSKTNSSSSQNCVTDCQPTVTRKCGTPWSSIKTIPNDLCSIPYTHLGKLYYSCSQLFNPNCTSHFCLGANREALYCASQSGRTLLDAFIQVIAAVTTTVPPIPVQVINNWLVILQRIHGNVSFDQNYKAYRAGFGDPSGDHWLGLLRMNVITSYTTFRLRFEIKFTDGRWISDEYGSFRISPEGSNFRLYASRYVGDNGDVLTYLGLTGRAFKVKDNLSRMEEEEEGRNCTFHSRSGWWFKNECNDSMNLNAPFSEGLSYLDYASAELKPVSVLRMMMIPRVI